MDDINDRLCSCLYFSSNKLARIIGKIADEEFRITGLSPSYAFLLSIVHKNSGIGQKEIGEILHMTPSTITRFIDKLENKGLLVRKNDGKNTFISLTEKGSLLQPVITKAWGNLNEKYSEMLTAGEKNNFILAINNVINKLEEKS